MLGRTEREWGRAVSRCSFLPILFLRFKSLYISSSLPFYFAALRLLRPRSRASSHKQGSGDSGLAFWINLLHLFLSPAAPSHPAWFCEWNFQWRRSIMDALYPDSDWYRVVVLLFCKTGELSSVLTCWYCCMPIIPITCRLAFHFTHAVCAIVGPTVIDLFFIFKSHSNELKCRF